MRDDIPFNLIHANVNINNEGRGGFDLAVPQFG